MRNFRRTVLAGLIVVTWAAAAPADTVEWTFDKFDTAEWEAVNCTPEVLPDGGGLKIHVKPGDKWLGITGKTFWEDLFDIRVEYELVGAPDQTHVFLRLFNDEKKRRVDLMHDLRLYKNDKGEVQPSSYSNLYSYHDDKLMGQRGSHRYGLTGGLRFTRDGTELYAFQGDPGGGWVGPFDYPYVPMHYDCDRYRVGVYLAVPANAAEFDLILKRVRVWDSLHRGPDRKPEEGSHTRAMDETEKDPKIWRFDFGPPGQQLERFHLPITEWTTYDKRRGWGWVTDLEPFWPPGRIPGLRNEDAVKAGLEPTPNLHYWRGGADMQMNYCMAHKKRYLLSGSHGGDYVQFFERWMDLKIPCERDLVCSRRPYGFPLDTSKEADQWERRGAIYVDDDLEAEFAVDLPNDRYTLLVGIGYTGFGAGGGSSFHVEAEGIIIKKGLNENWRRCCMFQCDDVEVADGQLNLKIRADRRLAMNNIAPWSLGVSWQLNYLVLIPSERREDIKAEQWRLINDRGRKVRQVTFVPGEPMGARVVSNHLVVDEKPFFPHLWQAFHANTQMHYPYYLWGNTMATIAVGWHFRGSAHFMQSDWRRLSAADDYPWMEINSLNLAYVWGSNTLLRVSGFLNFMPREVAGEGGTLQDARGRTDRWNVQPPLNSRLEREIQKEAYSMTSQQLKLHPEIMGHYMYEEFWHPRGQGYDWQSKIQFHNWLTQKYKTIAALNAEWGSSYDDFSEIKPPPEPEESACWANFRRFRMYAQEQTIKYPRDLLKELEPDRITFGAKGDYATASWYYAKDVELFGWYSVNTARQAAYYFGQVPMVGGEMYGCPWGWDDGRKQLDHKPAYPKKYRNPGAGNEYNQYMTKVFRGARGFYNEEYDDGIQHMFHRTRYIETNSKAGLIRMWYGALAQFDDPAFEGPDVFIGEGPLKYTRFMAWAYRNAPLFLPAKVPQPPVAVVSTDESYYEIPGTAGLMETNHIEGLMDQIEVPVDVLRSGRFDDYTQYKVLILGGFSEMLRPDQAEKVKEFVRRGGKVLWLVKGGFRSGIDLKLAGEKPRFELTRLTGCEFKDAKEMNVKGGEPVVLVPNALTPSVTEQVQVGETDPQGLVIVPRENCTVLARSGEHVYAVASPDRSVITLNLSLGLPSWRNSNVDRARQRELQQKLQAFFSDIFRRAWEVDPGYEIEGAADLADIDFGLLNGDGYSMFALVNNAKEEQHVTVKCELPEGRWELVDVTGRRPVVVKDASGHNRLDPDPGNLYVKVLAKDIAHDDLRRRGVKLTVPGRMTRVVLARPVGTEVLVDCHDYTLKNRVSRPVTLVVGDDAPRQERDAAGRLKAFLDGREVPVQLVKASEVKITKTRHEVRVDPRDGKQRQSSKPGDQTQWFLVEVFENAPVDTEKHLICVGSEETNALVKHLGLPGTFTYDKVLEKVTSTYPGAGRGVIQTVDSVNFPFYQSNRATRDAILIGGSDEAGTAKAVDTFLAMIKDLPKYVPPVAEEEMEIDDTPEEPGK